MNRPKSLVQEKSFDFAVELIRYSQGQKHNLIALTLMKQLLRSGTSIGANVEEALGGQSRKDFVAKLGIAAKEARETCYWLRLLSRTHPQRSDEITRLLTECDGLVRMLNSIILTTRMKTRKLGHQYASAPKSSELLGNSELITQNSELHLT
jgi:four helix bundle protein